MIDTHSHIYSEEFDDDREVVVERARMAGVKRILMPSENLESQARVDAAACQFSDICLPMIGLHPENVKEGYSAELAELRSRLYDTDRYIAIGEIGMDLYWDKTFKLEQQRALDEQAQWAMDLGLPLMLHTREAYPELHEVLSPYKNELTGVFHCFSGTVSEAQELLSYPGFMLGVGGILTFKKSTLAGVLSENVPLERIVLETDSPYLAPVPMRGKRNESSFIVHTAERLAECYDTTFDEIDRITTENAIKIFGEKIA